jgi:hypothetical protein
MWAKPQRGAMSVVVEVVLIPLLWSLTGSSGPFPESRNRIQVRGVTVTSFQHFMIAALLVLSLTLLRMAHSLFLFSAFNFSAFSPFGPSAGGNWRRLTSAATNPQEPSLRSLRSFVAIHSGRKNRKQKTEN